MDTAIETFLLCYRSTPCRSAPEGKSPAEVLLGRRLRTSLELVLPPTGFSKRHGLKQELQFNRKHGAKPKSFDVKDKVYAKLHRGNNWSWIAGEIVERIGTVLYNVWVSDRQQLMRCHSNQLRNRFEDNPEDAPKSEKTVPLDLLLDTWGLNPATASDESDDVPIGPEDEELAELQQEFLRSLLPEPQRPVQQQRSQEPRQQADNQPPVRRTPRNRKAPVRYDPYHLY